MKAQIFTIIAVCIIGTFTAFAQPTKSIVITDTRGIEYVQPVKAECADENLPMEVVEMIQTMNQLAAYERIDLTELTKPEKEEPLPFDLQKVFKTAKK